jgi:acetoin utilization deacetylase AcuC-like enzyme
MATLLLAHPVFTLHAPPPGHPERPDRMRAIEKVIAHPLFTDLKRREAERAGAEDILLVHPESYLRKIESSAPEPDDVVALDPDTWMNEASLEAAYRAVGAGIAAVDAVMSGEVANAFCAVRPPGHHAETSRAMGFCLFSSIAIAAHHAKGRHGLERVAVVDFDVHHGNGTQEIFWSKRDLFYGSTHQMPLFPGTGALRETGVGNIWNAPLKAGDGTARFREALETRIFPALIAHRPELILISAGFDAHRNDPLGGLELTEADFAWVTLKLMDIADRVAGGRVVSMLEGGYDLTGLSRSVAAHVQALLRGTGEGSGVATEGRDNGQ